MHVELQFHREKVTLQRFQDLKIFLLYLNQSKMLWADFKMCGSRGGDRGSGPPLETYKNIGFLGNTGPDPLKITKLPIQNSMLGLHLPASETPFKWHFADWLLIARL